MVSIFSSINGKLELDIDDVELVLLENSVYMLMFMHFYFKKSYCHRYIMLVLICS